MITQFPMGFFGLSGGNDSFTKLLLHMNGVDTSTTFIDSSVFNHNLTVNDVEIDTDITFSGFGETGLFDGTDNISVPSHEALVFPSDFTIDFKIRHTSVSGTQFYFVGDAFSITIRKDASDIIVNLNNIRVIDTGWLPSINTEHHIALTRNGNDVRFFADGIQQGSTGSSSYSQPQQTLYLFANSSQTQGFVGNGDEFRISENKARWISNFTPSTIPYT